MIQTSESSRIYLGNNSISAPYPVPFKFHDNEDLIVVVKDADGVEDQQFLGTDYTVTGAADPDGGSVTTTWPVPSTSQVSIVRIVSMTQLTAYEEGDSFPAKSHERALDKLTMICQQLSRASGTGTGEPDDVGTTFRVTDASGPMRALAKVTDTTLGVHTDGEAILRTPTEMLSWLGQVGTSWANDAERASTRGAFAGQTGVQTDNWTIYVARSTAPGDWVPHLKESGVVISTNGTPTAKMNPDGDIVGTTHAQTLTNKTLNACAIHAPTGLTAADVGLGDVDNTSDENAPVSIPQQIALQQKQDIAVKGFALGYASLDGVGKVPIDQIPTSLTGGSAQFQGVWNANTNTPAIPAASPANNGFYYMTNVAGTSSAPTGSPVAYAIGDQVISNGTTWQKIPSSAAVTSVEGRTGAIDVTKADVGLSNVDNTSDTQKLSLTGTFTNKTIKGSQNTLEVRLDADVINNLPVSRLNGGTGAGPNTWWCGDQSWKQPSGTGDTTGVASSVVGEAVVFGDTDGKHIKGFAGTAGFAIFTPGNAVTTAALIGPTHMDPNFIHGLTEKVNTVEDDEVVVWDSATGTLMKVKKKNLGVPPGTIIDWFGDLSRVGVTVPTGYLLMDGRTIIGGVALYPELAAILSTSWISGANLIVPDFRGFVCAGKDNMGGTNAGRLNTMGSQATTIGGNGGAQTHSLTIAELANHNHGINDYYQYAAAVGGGGPIESGNDISVGIYAATVPNGTLGTGSNAAHNNIQPTRIVNKLIKY